MVLLPFKNIRFFDWGLLAIILVLISFSLIIIHSLDLSQGNDFFLFKKQLAFIAVGLVLFFIFTFLDYKIFNTYSYWLYLFALLMMIAVLFVGDVIRGTKGWFVIGGVQFQPVELLKIALIVVLARFFSKRAYEIKTFKFIVLSGILFAPAFLLVMLQPDLGSALVLFAIWFGMLLVSGLKKKHFFIFLVGILIVFTLAWFFGFKDYQKERIATFLNPASDALGIGYNVIQSTIAVGSGRVFGQGVSSGSQTQLQFLPEAHTDFIFASLGEAFGFVGTSLVLFFYGLFFYRIIIKLKGVRSDFAIFLTLGVLIYFISQIVSNIAMNISMAPVIGLPLPFLSYGGSSLVMSFVMVGIISNILIKSQIDR